MSATKSYVFRAWGEEGAELWITDGTPGGTRMLKEFMEGNAQLGYPLGGDPQGFSELPDGRVLFQAYGSGGASVGLWVTDGTEAGTIPLKVLGLAPQLSDDQQFGQLQLGDGRIVFRGDDAAHGLEFWVTDGTAEGTHLLADLVPGADSIVPESPTPLGDGRFVFSGRAQHPNSKLSVYNRALYVSDGTSEGTRLVVEHTLGSDTPLDPQKFIPVGDGKVLFASDIEPPAPDRAPPGKLFWITDGTAEGTVRIPQLTIEGAFAWPQSLIQLGDGRVALMVPDAGGSYGIWVSDGTVEGTRQVPDLPAVSSALTPLSTGQFVFLTQGADGFDLWRSDGTSGGTELIRSNLAGDGVSVLRLEDGKVMFHLNEIEGSKVVHGELWVSDGTAAGTVHLDDTDGAVLRSLFGSATKVADGTWIFGGTDLDGRSTAAWVTDGQPGGTHLLTSADTAILIGSNPIFFEVPGPAVNHAPEGSIAVSGTAQEGSLLTASATEITDADGLGPFAWQWMRSGPDGSWMPIDGARAATYRLTDVDAGHAVRVVATYTDGQGMVETVRSAATRTVGDVAEGALGHHYLFSGYTDGQYRGLWMVDADTGETHLVKDISVNAASLITLADGRVTFSGNDGVHGQEIWISDGTEAGTAMIKDINPLPPPKPPLYQDYPYGLIALSGGGAMFVANDGAHGYEVWVTDGTSEGTRMVAGDLLHGSGARAVGLAEASEGRVVFYASDADGIYRLWGTDGTEAGTHVLTVEHAGDLLSFKDTLSLGNGLVLLTTRNSGVWVTDGREAGTYLLDADWNLGDTPARVDSFTAIGDGQAVFVVHGATAAESGIWVTDGTSAGTHRFDGTWQGLLGPHDVPLGDGRIIHAEPEPGTYYASLWLLDGDQRILLREAGPDSPYSEYLSWAALPDGRVLIAPTPNNGPADGVWISDGTAEGTRRLSDVHVSTYLDSHPFAAVTLPAPHLPDFPSEPAHHWSAANMLFDEAFYLSHNPDVVEAGVDPLQHFLAFGGTEGRDPNSHFDISFYLNQNPDVAAAGINALEHYMASGWHEGRAASFAFDGGAYLAANDDVARAGMNPLEHYLHYGEAEHRAAPQAAPHPTGPQNPLMDASFYFSTYADVAREGVDPTQHFMASGWQEGRDPNAFFDTDWYLAHNPDVASAHVNPLEHYLAYGAAEGRAPGAAFDGEAYLAHNPDVAAAGMNPLAHYLAYGMAEHRDVFAT